MGEELIDTVIKYRQSVHKDQIDFDEGIFWVYREKFDFLSSDTLSMINKAILRDKKVVYIKEIHPKIVREFYKKHNLLIELRRECNYNTQDACIVEYLENVRVFIKKLKEVFETFFPESLLEPSKSQITNLAAVLSILYRKYGGELSQEFKFTINGGWNTVANAYHLKAGTLNQIWKKLLKQTWRDFPVKYISEHEKALTLLPQSKYPEANKRCQDVLNRLIIKYY